MWSLFLDAVTLLPSEHEKLIDLLYVIEDLFDAQLKERQKGTSTIVQDTSDGESYAQKMWKDLPRIHWDLCDFESSIFHYLCRFEP